MILNKLFRNQEYISYLIVIFFTLTNFFIIQNPFESIFTNYDQEFWNTYNSLLIYSGLEQEKYDEPGHISYLLFAIYLGIINFFQIIDVPKINDLNEIENFSETISLLIFHSRLFGLIVNLILTFLIIRIFKKFDAKNLIFLTLILITSNGFLTHTSQYRVEPMTLSLFLISMITFINLIESQSKTFLKLFFFNFFIILSIINKVQIIFYIPFFLLILLNYKKFNFPLKTNIRILVNNKKNLLYFFSSSIIIIIAILIRSEQIHSSVYLISIYLIFLLSFYCIKEIKNNEKIFYKFNFSLLLSFLIIYFLVTYFTYGGKSTFWVFFKISKIRAYLGDPQLDQKYDTFLWIKDFIIFSFKNFQVLFFEIIKIKASNLIIFLIIFLTIFSKEIRKHLVLNIFIGIYLITKFITLFRANLFYYEIYFDWLILLGLIVFFNNFKIKTKFVNFIFIAIILLNLLTNFNEKNFNLINSGSYTKENYCSENQIYSDMGVWSYYSKRINKEQILSLCEL